jgi:hypothetical protein
MKPVTIACLVLAVPVAFVLVMAAIQNPETPAPAKAKTEEEKLVEKLRGRTHDAVAGYVSIQKSMRNPSGFELIQAKVMENGSVCYTFRGQNGFGGMGVESAVMTPKGNITEDTGIYNKYCAGKHNRGLQVAPVKIIPD